MLLVASLLPGNAVSRFLIPSASTFVWGLSVFPVSADWLLIDADESELPMALSTEAEPWVKYRRTAERFSLDVDAALTAVWSPTHITYSHPWERSPGWELGYTPRVAADVEWYPFRLPLGLSASGNLGRGWNAEHYPAGDWPWDEYYSVDERRTVNTSAGLELGISLGRTRDATPVVLALRVEEILRDEELVRGRLDDAAIQRIADLIARRWVAEFRHDWGRSNASWYDELERGVRELAPGAEIPAQVWLRIRDALVMGWYGDGTAGLTGIPVRVVGVRLRPVVAASHRAWVRRTIGHTWAWPEHDSALDIDSFGADSLRFGLRLDAGWPLTTRTHLLATGAYSPALEHAQAFELTVSHLVGEVLHVQAGLGEHASLADNLRSWGAQAEAGLNLFLVDRVGLGVKTQLDFQWYGPGESGRAFSVAGSIAADVTCRLN